MTTNNSKPKGCAGRLSMMVGGIFTLLTAAASCVGILQYIERPVATPVVTDNPARVDDSGVRPVSDFQTTINQEQWQAVEGFLKEAVAAEIAAYQYGDPVYAATMFSGDALQTIQYQIEDLNSRGVLLSASFDYDNSYIKDIRIVQTDRIEVDSCEYWSNEYYDRQNGTFLTSDPRKLVPQTILIEYLDQNFYITSIAFYTGQAFCY